LAVGLASAGVVSLRFDLRGHGRSERFVDDKPYWDDGRIGAAAGRELTEEGSLAHSPTFRLGRPLLNEVFYPAP
jgi:alpha-beta hydrolase superfamily lysophospholipase